MTATLDRVRESVIVAGTTTVALSGNGANGGFRPFRQAMTNGQTVNVCILDTVTFAWEVCTATWNAIGSAGQLTRGAVSSSSNGNVRVNFGGNTCDVFVTLSYAAILSQGNVLAYGAVCDGVTDDGAALAAACAAGGDVYIPGPSLTNQTLRLPSNSKMRGIAGLSRLIYGAAFAANALFAVYGPSMVVNWNYPATAVAENTVLDSNIHFEGITFDMTNAANPPLQGGFSEGESKAIVLWGVKNHTATNCDFIYGGDGICCVSCYDYTHTSCRNFGVLNAGFDNFGGCKNYRNVACYFEARAVYVETGATTLNSNVVTVGNSVGLFAGMTVSGPGIPVNTGLNNVSGNILQLSGNATATASGVTLTFTHNNFALLWNGLPGWTGGTNDGLDIVAPQFFGGISLDTLTTNCSATNISIQGGEIRAATPLFGRGAISNVRLTNTLFAKTIPNGIAALWIDIGAAAGGGYTGNPDDVSIIGVTVDTGTDTTPGLNAVQLYSGGPTGNFFGFNRIKGSYQTGLNLGGHTVKGCGNRIDAGTSLTVYGNISLGTDTAVPAVSGSKSSGAALTSLLAALVTVGVITDGTSA